MHLRTRLASIGSRGVAECLAESPNDLARQFDHVPCPPRPDMRDVVEERAHGTMRAGAHTRRLVRSPRRSGRDSRTGASIAWPGGPPFYHAAGFVTSWARQPRNGQGRSWESARRAARSSAHAACSLTGGSPIGEPSNAALSSACVIASSSRASVRVPAGERLARLRVETIDLLPLPEAVLKLTNGRAGATPCRHAPWAAGALVVPAIGFGAARRLVEEGALVYITGRRWRSSRQCRRGARTARGDRPGDVACSSPARNVDTATRRPPPCMRHVAIGEALDGTAVDRMERVSDERYQAGPGSFANTGR